MAASLKRTPFNPAGPFRAKKNFSVLDVQILVGKTYPASAFSALSARRLETMFDAGYIVMGDPDAKLAKAEKGASPLDRDGDGRDGGSLTEIETAALNDAGLTVAEWLKLPEPERTTALADALSRAGASASSPPDAAGGAGGSTGGDDGSGDTKVVEIKHSGFGRWFAYNAAGDQIGEKMSKGEATSLATSLGIEAKGLLS